MNRYLLSILTVTTAIGTMVFAGENIEALKAIDSELANLKTELNEAELKESKEDTESQSYMLEDWQRYEKETQDISKAEKGSEQIKKRINFLEQKKAQLQQNFSK